MAEVYTVFGSDKEFVAFWRSNQKTLSIYVSLNADETFSTHHIDLWKKTKKMFTSGDQNYEKYKDDFNFAWHCLRHQGVYIDRKKISKSANEPGIYHPRIWRGYLNNNPMLNYTPVRAQEVYGAKYHQSIVAASSLFSYLVELFRFIEPTKDNASSYGHRIRELLILVCTEIETSWRSILEDNNYKGRSKKRYTTQDYIKLKKPLCFDEWSVSLKDYPSFGALKPYKKWDAQKPTSSLLWYDAYNAVKHHRENEFNKATLSTLLDAMAALHVLQVAQWGPEIFGRFYDDQFSPFQIVSMPEFKSSDMYLPSLDGDISLVPKPYFQV